jgi:hypothetical protein
MVGQKGGGRRCAGRSAPRGHAHCRRAATPSRFAGDGLCGWPPPWHRRLGSSRAAPGNARGCADERRSGQAGANRPWFDPTAHSQRITPVLTGPPRRKPLYANRHRPTNRLNYGFQTGRGLVNLSGNKNNSPESDKHKGISAAAHTREHPMKRLAVSALLAYACRTDRPGKRRHPHSVK